MNKILLFTFLACLMLLNGCKELQMLEIEKVEGFGISSISKSGLNVEFKLLVNNPNNLKIKVKDYNLDVYINNVKLGKAEIDEKVVFPAKESSTQKFKVQAEFKGMAFGLVPLLKTLKKGNEANIRIVGDMKAGAMMVYKTVPIEFQKTVALSK